LCLERIQQNNFLATNNAFVLYFKHTEIARSTFAKAIRNPCVLLVHAKIVNHVLEHHIHSVTYINPFTKILVLSVSFSVFPNKVEIC